MHTFFFFRIPAGPSPIPSPPTTWRWSFFLPALLAASVCTTAWAQPSVVASEPANVVQLTASAFKEVPQDWLTMSLGTVADGADAVTVQNQLKVALESALRVARPLAQAPLLEVRTGAFSLYPRYGSHGRITGWQGRTELVLEGRDFARISSTAGKIQTLTLGHVSFGLSREAQQALESAVQALAIERFQLRASEIAKGFGFGSYSLREIVIGSADQGGAPVPSRMLAMQANAAMADAPVPVEPGTSTLHVSVSGSIQLR